MGVKIPKRYSSLKSHFYGGVLVPHVKKKSYVGDISYVGLIISYVGLTISPT